MILVPILLKVTKHSVSLHDIPNIDTKMIRGKRLETSMRIDIQYRVIVLGLRKPVGARRKSMKTRKGNNNSLSILSRFSTNSSELFL